MPSWLDYCRRNSKPWVENEMAIRMTGIRISERDARDTYADMIRDGGHELAAPFSEVSAITAYGLTIEWTPEVDYARAGWRATYGGYR